MKKKRKPGEMTFQEFWEEAKKEGVASEFIEVNKRFLLETLRREGFSEQQINEMKMEKIWKLFLDSLSVDMDKYMTEISIGLEKRPWAAPIVALHIKKLRQILEEWNKELEEKLRKHKKGEG